MWFFFVKSELFLYKQHKILYDIFGADNEYKFTLSVAVYVCVAHLATQSLGRGRVRMTAQHFVQAVLRTLPAPRDTVARSWARSHDCATAREQVPAVCLHAHFACTHFWDR